MEWLCWIMHDWEILDILSVNEEVGLFFHRKCRRCGKEEDEISEYKKMLKDKNAEIHHAV